MTISQILSCPNKRPSYLSYFTDALSKGDFDFICNIDFYNIDIPDNCPISVSSLFYINKNDFEINLPIYIIYFDNIPFSLIYLRDPDISEDIELDSTFIFNKELFIKAIKYFESLTSFNDLFTHSLSDDIDDLNFIYGNEDVSKLIFDNNISLSFNEGDFVLLNTSTNKLPFKDISENNILCRIIKTDSSSLIISYVLELVNYKVIPSFFKNGDITHSFFKITDILHWKDVCPDFKSYNDFSPYQKELTNNVLFKDLIHPKISISFSEEKYLSRLDSYN